MQHIHLQQYIMKEGGGVSYLQCFTSFTTLTAAASLGKLYL